MAKRNNWKKNLVHFKKGDPKINRKGAPKLPNLREVLERTLGKEDKSGKTGVDKIIEKLQKMALRGNTRAAEMLIDRGFGRTPQVIDQTINDNRKSANDLFPKEE